MRAIPIFLAASALVACVADDGIEDDATEDLGSLDGKADKLTTRNVTLRPVLASGSPSRRTFTITTRETFRASISYEPDAPTRITVLEGDTVIAESPLTWQPTVVVPAVATARQIAIRVEHAGATSLPVKLHVATPDHRALRVATFNVLWYGVGGDIDKPAPESRNATLRAFMAANLPDADVIVFEEIVDITMLRKELVPADWTCVSYDNTTPKHQFVVACHSAEFRLTREADDTDLAYQPLAMGTLRPAVAGVLRDAKTGAPLARIAGVHLKAMPPSTEQRLSQAKILVDRIAALAAPYEQLPVILLGDFNSHRAVDTGRPKDDWDLISDVFATQPKLGLAHVEHTFTNTFRDKEAKAYKLDHMWLAGAKARDVAVAGACNLAWETDRPAIERHFDEISDHCPLVATIELP